MTHRIDACIRRYVELEKEHRVLEMKAAEEAAEASLDHALTHIHSH